MSALDWILFRAANLSWRVLRAVFSSACEPYEFFFFSVKPNSRYQDLRFTDRSIRMIHNAHCWWADKRKKLLFAICFKLYVLILDMQQAFYYLNHKDDYDDIVHTAGKQDRSLRAIKQLSWKECSPTPLHSLVSLQWCFANMPHDNVKTDLINSILLAFCSI